MGKKANVVICSLFLANFCIVGIARAQKQHQLKEAVDYVNPLIGTAITGFHPGLDGGGTMPCVNEPFAMTNFVAQTCENKISRMAYEYEDSTILGFLATHQPTVWMGDYGYVSVMPQIGHLRVLPRERRLKFNHRNEVARPYYYSALLDTKNNKKIKAEISATSRCALLQFTFPQSSQSHIIIQGINLDSTLADHANDLTPRLASLRGYVHIDNGKGEITGYNPDRQSSQLGPGLKNFKGYFIIQFDKPFDIYGTWNRDSINSQSEQQYGTEMGAYISFRTKKNEKIKVKIATSFISLDQARENLNKEIPNWDIKEIVASTRNKWEQALSSIKLGGDVSFNQKTIFYTALFHCLLFPREFSEYGKYYSAFDDTIHEGISYNDYSLWDTFRALHPLLTIIQPKRVNQMIQSLIQMYEEGGWMPKWPNPTYTNIMIGTHADAMIADAYVKGFRDFDTTGAYHAMRKDAMIPPDCDTRKVWGDRYPWTSYEGRGGLSYYHSIGYVPSDKVNESVSRTIEFSIDDYCVAQVARLQGRLSDYKKLMAWSRNYQNVYNKSTGFMAPRKYDGDWDSQVNAGFTEGTNWTYTFGAMHDVPGMIEMMGGNKKFAKKLTENFAGGHYRADNEPGQHYIYLFDYCGEPWKTQELARQQTSTVNYRNEPIGINGNDDCGQTSAWYIFSVMGFYPVSPASGEYAIGAPQFPEITLDLQNGKQFQIKALNLSDKNKYIKSITLNGKPLSGYFISHADIIKGGQLTFQMTDHPVKN
ncbi:MAG TPA: GH92 family glycosyl hydrolase [Chitinophagaceae bacterium]|nr:GH92 family glycosyl hydrolase [Chitinophagaceae bacterium]